jgi:hypothetical protein
MSVDVDFHIFHVANDVFRDFLSKVGRLLDSHGNLVVIKLTDERGDA